MSLRDRINFIKYKILEKDNIIILIALSFLSLIIYACLTVMNFSNDFKKTSYEYDNSYRMILTNASNDILDKIEHISYYTSELYFHNLYSKVKDFDTNIAKGEVYLKALLKPYNIEIIHGRNIKNHNEAICPEKFYPHTYDDKIHLSLYKKGADIIGKNIPIISRNEDNPNIQTDIKIVGTYKNLPFVESNTCFVTEKTLKNNASKYSRIITTIDGDGNKIEEKYEYSGKLVFADKSSNIDSIKNELEAKGYTADIGIMEESLLQYIFYIPLFICLIILIITINIMYSFIVKKVKYRNYQFGILKAIGYHDEEIIKNEIYENTLICTISFIISYILLLIITHIIKNEYLSELIYYNYNISIPITYIIVSSITIIVLFILLTQILLKKTLKDNISKLLENEVK